MLFGLATQGNAPRWLSRVNERGVPVRSIALSALATSIGVLINYVMPGKAFELLMALVVSTLVINWIMICMAHLRFRKAILYPYGNYLCLLFLAAILIIMLMTPGIRISVLLIPVWVGVIWLGLYLSQRRKAAEVLAHGVKE